MFLGRVESSKIFMKIYPKKNQHSRNCLWWTITAGAGSFQVHCGDCTTFDIPEVRIFLVCTLCLNGWLGGQIDLDPLWGFSIACWSLCKTHSYVSGQCGINIFNYDVQYDQIYAKTSKKVFQVSAHKSCVYDPFFSLYYDTLRNLIVAFSGRLIQYNNDRSAVLECQLL